MPYLADPPTAEELAADFATLRERQRQRQAASGKSWFERIADRWSKFWLTLFLGLTVAFSLFFFREHLFYLWLVLINWLGLLQGRPWPADDDSMVALLYFVRRDQQIATLITFATDLLYGGALAFFTIGVASVADRAIYDRLKRSR